MIPELVVLVMGVFFVWEFALEAVPLTLPPWLQPLLVFGAALALSWPDWKTALAVGGGVALLHVWVRGRQDAPLPPTPLTRKTVQRVPDLP